MRIQLPECYHGLPLKAQHIDPNKNVTITPNDMWPCKLSELSVETPQQTQTQTELNSTITETVYTKLQT